MNTLTNKLRATAKAGRLLFALTLTLALSLAASAHAQSPEFAAKAELFSRIYHGSSSPQFVYHPGYCSSNILSLYFIFGDLSLSREGDKIAVIFEQDRSSFFAQNARLSKNLTKPQPFTFHVIYISEGMVFDFDHGQEPRIEGVADYLAKQFPAGGPGNKHLLARIYSPRNYMQAFEGASGNPLILDPKNLSDELVDLHSLSTER